MTEPKKKRKAWRWLLGAIVLCVVLFLGLYYTKLGGGVHNNQTIVPNQTQNFAQGKIQQAQQFIQNSETELKTKLVILKEQDQNYPLDTLETVVSPLNAKLGINNYFLALSSILLVTLTLAALIVGWYLRRSGKKKWLGYIISFIGFLPILPLVIVCSLVSWLSKKYWMSGKVSLKRKPLKDTADNEGTNPMNSIDDWEQAFKRLEKLQS